MTRRMVAAVASPHVDVLGHCTGRLLVGRGRPESTFDEDVIIEACRQFDTALEVNCRPERLDPPKRILTKAVEAGLRIAISTDAHAIEQLEWQAVRHRPRRRVRRHCRPGRERDAGRRSARVVRLAPTRDAVIDAVLFDFRGTLFNDEDDTTWIRNVGGEHRPRRSRDDEIADDPRTRLDDAGSEPGDRGRARPLRHVARSAPRRQPRVVRARPGSTTSSRSRSGRATAIPTRPSRSPTRRR